MSNEQAPPIICEPEYPVEKINQNVIPAGFGPEIYEDVWQRIKFQGGPAKTEKVMIESFGLHPSFVRAVIRKIMRERGW